MATDKDVAAILAAVGSMSGKLERQSESLEDLTLRLEERMLTQEAHTLDHAQSIARIGAEITAMRQRMQTLESAHAALAGEVRAQPSQAKASSASLGAGAGGVVLLISEVVRSLFKGGSGGGE